HKDLYDALVKSYKLEKDLFESYGKVYSLKRDREDKEKDKDRPSGSDQGLKKQKTSKDAEPSRGSKLKESKSSSSKGSKSQSKSSRKYAQAEEPVYETTETEMPLNQREDFVYSKGHAKAEWNSNINLKIENLTQEYLVRPAFNLLKGTCKSQVELEYHFEECYKDVIDRLDWTNPIGNEYPFDLSKPLSLIEDQGRQVVLANYFINNDLEYLKGRSLRKKYTTSTTKTKVAKYNTIEGIEDMVPSLWSPSKHDVFSTKRIIAITHVKVIKWYDYRYLEEIVVQREDQQFYKFKEGDFPRLNMRDIEDLLLLLVQKKLSNLEKDIPLVLAGSWERIPIPNHLITSMPTEMELVLEQTQQATSHEVSSGIHNNDGNPSRANIKQALWQSKHDGFSTKQIIVVTHVKVMKWYDYGYLEEIIVRREDQLYKFKEGDFLRLNMCDIEDLLLFLVQKKLSNLEKDVIFNLNVALRMFTRRVVILKRVEDLQLGVKSY
nr:hypothetical protein [Tanacetum cinerariifolium]